MNAVKSFCMCNQKRHGSRTQDCWSSMKFGCSLLNANSSQIRIYLTAVCRVDFDVRQPAPQVSMRFRQQIIRRFAASDVFQSDILRFKLSMLARPGQPVHPTSKTWLYLTYSFSWNLSIYIYIYIIYIYSLVLFALFCRVPSTPAFLRRIRHRQKRDTMRVSFVDVPLQHLEGAWIGLDRTLYMPTGLFWRSATASWMDTFW